MTDQTSLTPLPCPFCGAVPKIQDSLINSYWIYLSCQNHKCLAHIDLTGPYEKVLKRWNTRIPTALQASSVELQKQNDKICELNLALGRGIQSLAADMGITEQPGMDALTLINDISGYAKVTRDALKEKSDLLAQANNEIKALKEQVERQADKESAR